MRILKNHYFLCKTCGCLLEVRDPKECMLEERIVVRMVTTVEKSSVLAEEIECNIVKQVGIKSVDFVDTNKGRHSS